MRRNIFLALQETIAHPTLLVKWRDIANIITHSIAATGQSLIPGGTRFDAVGERKHPYPQYVATGVVGLALYGEDRLRPG